VTKAIILLSGGLDSTVVLALACKDEKKCYALSFDYGQRHLVELEAAAKIAKHYQVPHKIVKIDSSAFDFSTSSLTTKSTNSNIPNNKTIEEIQNQGIPNTYVPARNTLFLSYALGQCEILEAQEIHFGPNKMDFNGYADCRPSFVQAYQSLINVATKQSIENRPPKLITPLIYLDKTEIVRQGMLLNAPLDLTISCYKPKGNIPCLKCDACIIRANAFNTQTV
jgi:7-cyano-7-deazaguanine synthase